ncbi:uncharacterized protein K452DRAFT_293488 [Aplosporella prunicola CBS 121167]|uniref:Carboxylic ester hydrolase n=1 Tax=Aplosporella prunicola CBS 121167 TaxID=1176127 RepID=A0A6A6BSB9_9PEZI|nr:uncharacterized protein K452DRAFT_293488 [Aplosporella prunicola CBS 121167]KAF2146992.1 hypothetical protein K452DRAFT_293488 [Aplosporella prunicola CBS 121167]
MLILRPVAHAAAALVLLCSVSASPHNPSHNSSTLLPVVDLGYELYRANAFNETRGYYNFSNIRYAAPPIGDLRFMAPLSPVTDRSVINDGSVDRICHQGKALSKRDVRETEDCLFLDVIVQKTIFDKAGRGKGAPVLVWIYGGGYTAGSKAAERTPSGLIQRSITKKSDGVIYVAMNYRLGAFGWLSGPTFQENGTSNAGLHDQRFALQWVQDNIHLFGGDKNRVTVMGESAGGGSIVHQLTAYGGVSSPPFKQAIAQSPDWLAFPSKVGQETVFQGFLQAANVSSIDEARKLSSEELMNANAQVIAAASTAFRPTIDGDFVAEDPKALLLQGKYDKSVKVMVGHNTNEGLEFTPQVTTDAQADAFISAALYTAPKATVEYVTTTLYPHVSNGTNSTSALYTTPYQRLALILGEATILCNAYALRTAFKNKTYGYIFGVSPGLHGQDVPHTYYDPGSAPSSGDGGVAATLPFNVTVAEALQDYITTFAITGQPDSALDGLPKFTKYGSDASVVGLSQGGISLQKDTAANERCKWWGENLNL